MDERLRFVARLPPRTPRKSANSAARLNRIVVARLWPGLSCPMLDNGTERPSQDPGAEGTEGLIPLPQGF
jgi:hypothetical protein